MSPLTFLPRYSSQITEDDNEDHSDGDADDLGVDGGESEEWNDDGGEQTKVSDIELRDGTLTSIFCFGLYIKLVGMST